MAGASQLIQIELEPHCPELPSRHGSGPKPLSAKISHNLKKLARGLGLHTVCESAQCPNIGECWNNRPPLLCCLGISVRAGADFAPYLRASRLIDSEEPRRVAEAVATLGLKHAVVTSVNRDDEISAGRGFCRNHPRDTRADAGCRVEVLIPDFQGSGRGAAIVLNAQPDVLNHNTETVPRLCRAVRSGSAL